MRHWILGVLLLMAFLMQTTLAPHLRIGGATPDLLVAVTVSTGLLFGWQAGMGMGALGGLLVDLVFGRIIGLHTLAYGIIGWLCGLTEEKVFKDNWLLPGIGGLGGTLIVQSLMLAVLIMFGRTFDVWSEYRLTVFPSSIYNTILTPFVYTMLLKRYRDIRPDPRGMIVLRKS